MSEIQYRFVGPHLDDLDDGRLLIPGRFYENVNTGCAHNQRLIAAGQLIAVEPASIDATEAAVQYAAENGVNLADVTGSGADGRITKADVESYLTDKEA